MTTPAPVSRPFHRLPWRGVLLAALLLGPGLSGCVANRSVGTAIDDQVIEHRVTDDIEKADPALADAHIDVNSYDGAVLVVGQVPNAALRQLAAETAAKVPNVRRVYNYITVQPDIGFGAHASDALITTKVKSQLWAQQDIKDSKMQVLTEDGVVYLMGIVSQHQADLAAKVAQGISGVQKVVTLFEISDSGSSTNAQ